MRDTGLRQGYQFAYHAHETLTATLFQLAIGDDVEKYLSADEVCEHLPGITPNLLAQMRFRGDGPPFLKPTPKTVLYRMSAVEEWLAAREQLSTRENVSR